MDDAPHDALEDQVRKLLDEFGASLTSDTTHDIRALRREFLHLRSSVLRAVRGDRAEEEKNRAKVTELAEELRVLLQTMRLDTRSAASQLLKKYKVTRLPLDQALDEI
ncbi:MAG: hypothetical protein GMKNLPBB_00087 [Myxococcota bacterium]|nr:hypothetical protein [Myxococcota bacterium]